MNLIVAGIGTDVGKTVVSAILCQALNADYWKPVQAGSLEHTDSDTVTELLAKAATFKTWPEVYRLQQAMSPHAAAANEDIEIKLDQLTPPTEINKNLMIELAGGLMVPLSDSLSTVDLIKQLGCPVVLVANYYLGSINHSLLSIHLLKSQQVPILGIIFNGEPNPQSREIILSQGKVELLGEIPHSEDIDWPFIKQHAEKIRAHPTMARL